MDDSSSAVSDLSTSVSALALAPAPLDGGGGGAVSEPRRKGAASRLPNRPVAKRVHFIEKVELYDASALRALRGSDAYSDLHADLRVSIDAILRDATTDPRIPKGALARTVKYWRPRYGRVRLEDGSSRDEVSGRAYASTHGNLQGMWARVRATLAAPIYVDVDMVNAAATIALAVSRRVVPSVKCPALETYVSDRENVLAHVCEATKCDRAEAKQRVIRCLFGGSPDAPSSPDCDAATDTPVLWRLRSEMTALAEVIKRTSWVGDEIDKANSALARYVFTLEHNVLMAAHDELVRRGWAPDVLIFDGMLVRHATDHARRITDSCEDLAAAAAAAKHVTGIDVKFVTKPMVERVALPPPYLAVENDQDAVAKLSVSAGSYVRRTGMHSYMFKFDGVWTSVSATEAANAASVVVANSDLYFLNKPPESATDHHRTKSASEGIATMMVRALPNDPSFREDLARMGRGRIFFRNGHWDFAARAFAADTDQTQTAVRIQHEFPARPDESALNEFRSRVLEPILPYPAERHAFLAYHARGLAGHIREKRWAVFLGPRNCGKSLLLDALTTAFEAYVTQFTADDLTRKPNSGNTEGAKAMNFAIDFEFGRLGIASEIREGDVRCKLDGTTIKKLSSGGDKITVRDLYCKARTFVPSARMTICANGMPEIVPECAADTMIRFVGYTRFVDRPTPEMGERLAERERALANARATGEDDGGRIYACMQADHTLKDYVCSDAGVAAFTHIVLDAYTDDPVGYVPASLVVKKSERVTDEDLVTDLVVATGDKADFVGTRELQARIKADSDRDLCATKVKFLLEGMGAESVQVMREGRRERGFRKVRWVEREGEECQFGA